MLLMTGVDATSEVMGVMTSTCAKQSSMAHVGIAYLKDIFASCQPVSLLSQSQGPGRANRL